MEKIVVVDADRESLALIGLALRLDGYVVVEVAGSADALAIVMRERPQLVILAVDLPAASGFELCRSIRSVAAVPILLLNWRISEEDEVYGLDIGADVCMGPPIDLRMLRARVRALVRRGSDGRPACLVVGDVRLDTVAQTISVAGAAPVRLTNREFRLLQYLLDHAHRPVSVEQLARHVWGDGTQHDRRVLKQLVHRLRKKIERRPAEPRYLRTVEGAGYLLDTIDSRGG